MHNAFHGGARKSRQLRTRHISDGSRCALRRAVAACRAELQTSRRPPLATRTGGVQTTCPPSPLHTARQSVRTAKTASVSAEASRARPIIFVPPCDTPRCRRASLEADSGAITPEPWPCRARFAPPHLRPLFARVIAVPTRNHLKSPPMPVERPSPDRTCDPPIGADSSSQPGNGGREPCLTERGPLPTFRRLGRVRMQPEHGAAGTVPRRDP